MHQYAPLPQPRNRHVQPLQLVAQRLALAGLINSGGSMKRWEGMPWEGQRWPPKDEAFRLSGLTSMLERLLSRSVLGTARMTEAVLPLLQASSGRIVNVGFDFGQSMDGTKTESYRAANAAVEALTHGIRRILGPAGARAPRTRVL